MSIQFFGTRGRDGTAISLRQSHRANVRWLPRIGDVFPDFVAASTMGTLRFRDWACGRWVYFFSHPAAFTPVCTTELAAIAANSANFASRGAVPLMLSRDTLEDQQRWIAEVSELFDVTVDFPAISDSEGVLARGCGMIHPEEHGEMALRKSFLIDPTRRIRMICEYPIRVGRDVGETLRTLDALREVDRLDIGTPAGWSPGGAVVLPRDMPDREADLRFGDDWERLSDYLRVHHPR